MADDRRLRIIIEAQNKAKEALKSTSVDLKSIATVAKETTAALKSMGTQLANVKQVAANASESLKSVVGDLKSFAGTAGAIKTALDSVGKGFDAMIAKAEKANIALQSVGNNLQSMAGRINASAGKIAVASPNMQPIVNSTQSASSMAAKLLTSNFMGAFDSIKGMMTKFGSFIISHFTNVFSVVRGMIIRVVAMSALIGSGLVFKGVIGAAAQLETYRAQLIALTGSAKDAGNVIGWVVKKASTTPFQIPNLTETAIQLYSVGLDIAKWSQNIGQLASLDTNGFDQGVETATNAVVRLKAGATGEAMESLRRLKISMDDFKKQGVEFNAGGEITSSKDEALSALDKIIAAKGDLMKAAEGTFSQMWSSVKDDFNKLYLMIAGVDFNTGIVKKGGLFDTIKDAVRGALDWFQKNETAINAWGAKIGKALAEAIKWFFDNGKAIQQWGFVFVDTLKNAVDGLITFASTITGSVLPANSTFMSVMESVNNALNRASQWWRDHAKAMGEAVVKYAPIIAWLYAVEAGIKGLGNTMLWFNGIGEMLSGFKAASAIAATSAIPAAASTAGAVSSAAGGGVVSSAKAAFMALSGGAATAGATAIPAIAGIETGAIGATGAVSGLAAAFTALWPVAAVVAAIALGALWIQQNWDKVGGFLKPLWIGLKNTALTVWGAIKGAVKSMWDVVGPILGGVLLVVLDQIIFNIKIFASVFVAACRIITLVFDSIKDEFIAIGAAVTGNWQDAWDAIKRIGTNGVTAFKTIGSDIKKIWSNEDMYPSKDKDKYKPPTLPELQQQGFVPSVEASGNLPMKVNNPLAADALTVIKEQAEAVKGLIEVWKEYADFQKDYGSDDDYIAGIKQQILLLGQYKDVMISSMDAISQKIKAPGASQNKELIKDYYDAYKAAIQTQGQINKLNREVADIPLDNLRNAVNLYKEWGNYLKDFGSDIAGLSGLQGQIEWLNSLQSSLNSSLVGIKEWSKEWVSRVKEILGVNSDIAKIKKEIDEIPRKTIESQISAQKSYFDMLKDSGASYKDIMEQSRPLIGLEMNRLAILEKQRAVLLEQGKFIEANQRTAEINDASKNIRSIQNDNLGNFVDEAKSRFTASSGWADYLKEFAGGEAFKAATQTAISESGNLIQALQFAMSTVSAGSKQWYEYNNSIMDIVKNVSSMRKALSDLPLGEIEAQISSTKAYRGLTEALGGNTARVTMNLINMERVKLGLLQMQAEEAAKIGDNVQLDKITGQMYELKKEIIDTSRQQAKWTDITDVWKNAMIQSASMPRGNIKEMLTPIMPQTQTANASSSGGNGGGSSDAMMSQLVSAIKSLADKISDMGSDYNA